MREIKSVLLFSSIALAKLLQYSESIDSGQLSDQPERTQSPVPFPSIPSSAENFITFASLNANFCGVQHCTECLHLLKVKGRELGANALKNRGYWTCTVIWLWEQCCPKWSGRMVQML